MHLTSSGRLRFLPPPGLSGAAPPASPCSGIRVRAALGPALCARLGLAERHPKQAGQCLASGVLGFYENLLNYQLAVAGCIKLCN